ncbi:MAG TPA: HK97 family phage prohead protease [Streptosporangiaceae bacterium]|nr:HK97 family phage prohead protease [Streptosporangiaceae bacterium]
MTGRDCGCDDGGRAHAAHELRGDVDSSAWDGPAAMSACSGSGTPASCFASICAGKKAGDTSTQGAWALPHHKHPGDAPNAAGVKSALARLPQTQGLTNAAAAKKHLEAHMSVISPAKAGSPAEVRQQRAESLAGNRRAVPGGDQARWRQDTHAANWRSALVDWNGKKHNQLDGYASVTGIEYEMWDMWGPYGETVSQSAFDATLAADPVVVFLINHTGLPLARTDNGTLLLDADPRGLHMLAYANPERDEVRNLVVGIDDKNVTEMSFAFHIAEGGCEWDDDFEHFTITEVSLDRGDVSAVRYGANPYTDITARARQIISDLDRLPPGAQRAALARLAAALGDDVPDPSRAARRDPSPLTEDNIPEGASVALAARKAGGEDGRSIEFYEQMLRLS